MFCAAELDRSDPIAPVRILRQFSIEWQGQAKHMQERYKRDKIRFNLCGFMLWMEETP
jgi:hypothetical protein